MSTFSGVSKDGSAFSQRVLIVSPQNVSVYCDAKGRPFVFPPAKGLGIEWPNKRSVAELSSTSTIGTASVSTMDAGSFPLMDDSPDSEPTPPAPGSRDSLKWLPDGVPVSVNGAVVSASFSDYGFFYVEKSDRSFGIWISASDYMYEGQLVDITGKMGTGGGERAVIVEQGGVTVVDYNTYPRPTEVGMPNKALGGGAVGLYTPAVADAAGLSNTGLLVRAWGKVKYVDTQNRIYYIDDGSGVIADGGHVGVKVYDLTYDTLPTVDSYQIVSGVSAVEWPQGSSTSIRVVWKTSSVTPATQSGSGTISGTITATGADGKTVKVYCASKSTTATFSGTTANYTLSVPYGSHAVTASIIGYKTTTQLATVSSGTSVDLDFTLSTIQRRIDVVASPWRIPPDGTSQTIVTAIVRDEEGRRYGNESITWNVDVGTVISSDATTDAVGEARLVLQSPADEDTGSISVTCGGTQGIGYIEYASLTAPSVRILTPTQNEAASGLVTVEVSAEDYAGTEPGIVHIGVVVDGQPLMPLLPGRQKGYWTTFRLPNGVHQIKAAATDLDKEAGFSQAVTVNVNNPAFSVAETTAVINPGNPSSTISATLTTSSSWTLEIGHPSESTPVRTFSGSGTSVSATWDGKNDGGTDVPSGSYKYSIKSAGTTLASGMVCVWRVTGRATALLVEGWDFPYNASEMDEVAKQCLKRNFDVISIPKEIATWQNFLSAYNTYPVQVLFVTSHGQYEIRNQDCVPSLIPQVTAFLLQDSVVYAYRPQDSQGNYFEEYPAPGEYAFASLDDTYSPDPNDPEWPVLRAHYVSEIPYNRRDDMTFVWMDTCFGGRIGSDRGNLTSRENPYAIVDYNDMASMFYIYDNAYTYGACYAGYYEQSVSDERYDRQVGVIFGSLGWGYTMDQCVWRDAYNYGGSFLTGIYTSYTENDGPCGIWRVVMPPYHNLRVHGNPFGFRLSPH